jgi:alkyl sulfatase BDS1-like metallo-beta-lactamase superfamily hydrolase
MTPEMFFDYLAVHINEKAGGAKRFNIDLAMTAANISWSWKTAC